MAKSPAEGARGVLGRIKAGAGNLAGNARAFLSRLAGGGIRSRNVAARSKGVRQKFGPQGPSAAQRATIERKGLASPIGGGGGE